MSEKHEICEPGTPQTQNLRPPKDGGRGRELVLGKAPFSDAASGEYPLVSTCTDHDGVDFVAIGRNDEVCHHGWPAISEVDGEGSGTIGAHRVTASGSGVGPIGDDVAVNGDSVNLTEPTLAVKLGHGHAHHWACRSCASQFRSLNGESIVAGDEFVIAGIGIVLCVS